MKSRGRSEVVRNLLRLLAGRASELLCPMGIQVVRVKKPEVELDTAKHLIGMFQVLEHFGAEHHVESTLEPA
jgi:hypothetical protein